MENLLWVLGIVLVFSILIAPIWILAILYDIRSRLHARDQYAEELPQSQVKPPLHEPVREELTANQPPELPKPSAAPIFPRLAESIAEPPAVPAWPVEAKPAPPLPEPPGEQLPTDSVDQGARRILRAIWNWLIVGEEYRRPGGSMEEAVATNWLIRIGVLTLVVGIGFFLKYSIERGLLGPQARVAMSLLTGAALVTGGVRLLGKRYHVLGQGLAGAGLATLYFAVFAAAGLFHLLPIPVGFVLMALVTLFAGILAVCHRTVLLAVLGTLGGYLTPVMLASSERNQVWLYGYLLLLALGVAGVSWRKGWPALTYLSFVCHNLVFFQALNWAPGAADFFATMPFFAAYFMVLTTAIFLPGIAGGKPPSALEPVGLFLIAGVFFAGGYELVRHEFDKASVAWVTLGMAAYYIAHVYLLLRRAVLHRVFLATFLGLAAGSLALTLPLLLSKAWLTLSWSVLGLTALWVALRLPSVFLRGLALALQCFVALKLGLLDLGSVYYWTAGAAASVSSGEYWQQLLEHGIQFGVPAACFWLTSRLLARQLPPPDRPATTYGGAGSVGFRVLMYVLLFFLLNLEFHRFGVFFWSTGQSLLLTLVWIGFGLHLLARHERLRPTLCASLAALALAALVIKFLVDFTDWDPMMDHLVFEANVRTPGALLRMTHAGLLVAYLALAWQVWQQRQEMRAWSHIFGYTALAILFLHLTFETATFFGRCLPGFRGGSVSMFWTLYAFALVMGGIRWRARPLRYLGLGLFSVVVAKVFLVDLDHLASVYRIAAFVALGVVLLLAAVGYLRQPRQENPPEPDTGDQP